jgi:arabinose-5-phosphate isomerase
MSRKGLGMTSVTEPTGRLLGVFTDGDLRRVLDRSLDLNKTLMQDVMTRNPKRAKPRMLAAEAIHLMEAHKITALPVVDDNDIVVGALNIHDLFRAGVV